MPDVVATNNAGDKVAIRLNGTNADITAGGTEPGKSGALIIKNAQGKIVASMGSGDGGPFTGVTEGTPTTKSGTLILQNAQGQTIVRLGSQPAGHAGLPETVQLELANIAGKQTIRLNADSGDAVIGGGGSEGTLKLRNSGNDVKIQMDAKSGEVLLSSDGKPRIHLDGTNANAWVGGRDKGGQIGVFPSGATDNVDPAKATIHLRAEDAALRVGGAVGGVGRPGIMYLMDEGKVKMLLDAKASQIALNDDDQNGIVLDGKESQIWLNRDGNQRIHLNAGDKTIVMRGDNNQETVTIRGGQADFWIGGNGIDGDVVIYPSTVSNGAPSQMSSIHLSGDGSVISIRSGGQETIRIDGKKGDIILNNADGAEEFEVNAVGAEPGSVLVIEDETRLRLADRPYDRRVAGIISGAEGIRPGIILGRGREGDRVPVALFGKVNCRVDASYGPVVAGDLLTTSQTPGYAMRAEPGTRAMGAVIGKALCGLDSGQGLVPVLVALQ